MLSFAFCAPSSLTASQLGNDCKRSRPYTMLHYPPVCPSMPSPLSKTKLASLRDREMQSGDAGISDPLEPPIIQQLRKEIRLRHLALKTEQAYAQWIMRFMRRFSIANDSSWSEISGKHVREFLTELAVEGNVAASSRIKPCRLCSSYFNGCSIENLNRLTPCVRKSRNDFLGAQRRRNQRDLPILTRPRSIHGTPPVR